MLVLQGILEKNMTNSYQACGECSETQGPSYRTVWFSNLHLKLLLPIFYYRKVKILIHVQIYFKDSLGSLLDWILSELRALGLAFFSKLIDCLR